VAKPCVATECDSVSSRRGLCSKHYQRAAGAGTLPPPTRPRVNDCKHGERPHFAHGLCHPCYMTKWNREHPDGNSGPGWVKRNPERAAVYRRNVTLRRRGITLTVFAEMWHEQDGRCANPGCRTPVPLMVTDHRSGLHVDHDHSTGKIRGLLCYGCNVALGLIQDSPKRLGGLVEYLRQHST